MSTIATPREGTGAPRRIPSSTALHTPSSSARPSLDINTSLPGSPNLTIPPHQQQQQQQQQQPKRNRAALREYYNLRQQSQSKPTLPSISLPPSSPSLNDHPGPPPATPASILDSPSFSPETYLTSLLESSSLSSLLTTYTRLLSEIRALDAEKKALVYDNYSKLITATETIRKMRTTMDPLNPMAGTLDLVVARVYDMARDLRGEMRGFCDTTEQNGGREKKKETRRLVREVYRGMERMRGFVQQGDRVQAEKEWELPRRLLVRWQEQKVGGGEVGELLREGDGILAGEEEAEEDGGRG
ncbi:Vps51/Vps67-domain-containing protein [Triangularia verruculosa]|uniref:Vacuolar protein sorting-associated protein 51 homolog n=1 Tax=Triangularia verruculosa TaxID=2587418 RepID=A0AAN6XMH7_9PEZI|nr:Vps51/Vps67-domain-containing protein [Triangularia verruculosa]